MFQKKFLFCLVILQFSIVALGNERKLISEHGKGYLETVDGYYVLHLKGDPNELGTQHGVLFKEHVQKNVNYLLGDKLADSIEFGDIGIPKAMAANVMVAIFRDKIPSDYLIEMKALAKASDLPEWKVIGANLIPELFHCSGFALLKEATAEGKLYHGRVLDYGVDWKLQKHAVLMIVEPEGKIPYVNVSYAGFIGSVTGMNLEQISIGEMGGAGVGQWDGVPMSFLVRRVLDSTKTLEQAIEVFKSNKRTCEYYYVIADAKANDAVGLRCVPEDISIVRAGQAHKLLPTPVKNTVLMSAGNRYKNLVKLTKKNYGKFDENSAIRLMDKPVAMKNNLHNALMIPEDGIVYVANADPNGAPAWQQKYYKFDIKKLIASKPN